MYYPYFIAYMAIGFAVSLVVFFWALNTGQFKDQQRARFIPLENDRAAIIANRNQAAFHDKCNELRKLLGTLT